MRLRWRIFPSYMLLTMTSLLVFFFVSSLVVREVYYRDVRNHLKSSAVLVGRAVASQLARGDSLSASDLAILGRDAGLRFTVVRMDGVVVGDSHQRIEDMENHGDRPELLAAGREGESFAIRHSDTLNRDMMYAALRQDDGEGPLGLVRAALPLDQVHHDLMRLFRQLLLAAFLLVLVAAAVSWRMGSVITHPIEDLESRARALSLGDLDVRMPSYDIRELHGLAKALNALAEKTQHHIDEIVSQCREYRAVLEGMVEGVVAVDAQDRVLSINRSAGHLLGIDASHCAGKPVKDLLDNREICNILEKAKVLMKPVTTEFVVAVPQSRRVRGHAAPLGDETSRVMGAVLVLNDVTQLHRLEQVRKDFVANVSHELKTPITTIKGFVETLLDGAIDKPEDARQFLTIVEKHTNRLNAILEDLLSLSKLEQSEGKLVRLPVDAFKLIENVLRYSGAQASEKGIQLLNESQKGLSVRAEASLLEQALFNLVDNAIKYCPENTKVKVSVEMGRDEARISVIDQGDGIPEPHLERIFERFYRVDKARSNKTGGTGLGLSIVKHIAAVHGGRAEVKSELGKGSTFSIVLPSRID